MMLQVVSEYEMYVVLSVFFAVDIIIMTAWSLINPFYPDIETFPREQPDVVEKDIELLPQLEHCHSQNLFIWYGAYTSAVWIFMRLVAPVRSSVCLSVRPYV